MSQVVVAFGVIFVLLGLAAAVKPRGLLGLARKVTVSTWLRLGVFALRLVLGVILLLVAPSTAVPLALQLIGVLLIVSAAIVLAIGNEGVQRIMNWAFGLGPVAVVTGGIIGVAFGAFLIYTAW